MIPRMSLAVVLVTLAACGEEQPSDSGWWEREAPDITGHYQFFVEGVSASNVCEDQTHYVTDWMRGTLGIAGDSPLELSFTFSDGMAFTGGVDSSWTWWFSGSETYDGASLAITGAGTIFTNDEQHGLSGGVEVEVDDDEFTTNNCLFEVRINGTRLSG